MGRGRRPRVNPEILVKMYRDNMPLRDIGERVGLHYTTVLLHLKKAGLMRRPHSSRPLAAKLREDLRLAKNGERERRVQLMIERRAEWVKLYTKEGYSLPAIARMYGKHHTTVLAELRKAGVPRRRRCGGIRPVPMPSVPTAPNEMSHEAQKHHRVNRMLELAERIERRKRGMAA